MIILFCNRGGGSRPALIFAGTFFLVLIGNFVWIYALITLLLVDYAGDCRFQAWQRRRGPREMVQNWRMS